MQPTVVLISRNIKEKTDKRPHVIGLILFLYKAKAIIIMIIVTNHMLSKHIVFFFITPVCIFDLDTYINFIIIIQYFFKSIK
jgi:hypothetical protein